MNGTLYGTTYQGGTSGECFDFVSIRVLTRKYKCFEHYSVTARPTGVENCVALPAIVWIGVRLPLADAAKPRIASVPESGVRTNISRLALVTASGPPPFSPEFEPAFAPVGDGAMRLLAVVLSRRENVVLGLLKPQIPFSEPPER